ncbi:hypothetical protein Taro_050458, partial [Colocasia esculenta]|nr:hypothetical protein [Colocasia esculenta]
KQSNIDVEDVKDELRIKASESLEAWKQMLESFKKEAIKMQGISQEAYEIYSRRAIIVLKETSQKVKVQADQARNDFNKLAKEVGQEGKEYLSTVAQNSPESMKDILETFSSSTDELKDVSDIRDFYFGIPYGGLLAIGGFLHFMLTGSISAVRFGVILGGALLGLSVSSLRAWRNGQSSALFLKGQAGLLV